MIRHIGISCSLAYTKPSFTFPGPINEFALSFVLFERCFYVMYVRFVLFPHTTRTPMSSETRVHRMWTKKGFRISCVRSGLVCSLHLHVIFFFLFFSFSSILLRWVFIYMWRSTSVLSMCGRWWWWCFANYEGTRVAIRSECAVRARGQYAMLRIAVDTPYGCVGHMRSGRTEMYGMKTNAAHLNDMWSVFWCAVLGARVLAMRVFT